MNQHPQHPKAGSPECRQILAQVCDYIDEELDAPLCAEIERHLAGCQDCQVLVDTTRKTIGLYRCRHKQAELPPGVTGRLWQALEQAGCVSK